jgi:HK97 family phage major capsid protein
VLGVRKVAGAVIVTKEAVEGSHGQDASLATELAGAIGSATDRAMFNVDSSASIAAAGTLVPSTGVTLAAIDTDIHTALTYFNSGDAALDRVVAVTSPAFALYLSQLRTNGISAFPTVNTRGGTLYGIPLFISNALAGLGSPGTSQLSFCDPAQILVADPGAIEPHER